MHQVEINRKAFEYALKYVDEQIVEIEKDLQSKTILASTKSLLEKYLLELKADQTALLAAQQKKE